MTRNGLLIQYEYCTGCYACEVACKQEHNYSAGQVGIKVNEIITEIPGTLRIDYLPFPTYYCDLCSSRLKRGENEPACVKHCQAVVMRYGPVTELAKLMDKQPKSVIFAPK